MIKKTKNKKGSVLIFTLFIMILVLITGISLVSASLSGRRSTMSSGKSVNAFQIADSGLEGALAYVKDVRDTPLVSARVSGLGGCSDGVVTANISGGTYEVTFYSDITNPDSPVIMECDETILNGSAIAVKKIKSVGIYRNTSRAVETTFATN